jgi:NTE family protein
VTRLRNSFNSKGFQFVFDGLAFKGFNGSQQRYLQRIFKINRESNTEITLTRIKRGYFNMIGEPYFSNVFPTIQFRPDKERFVLQLVRRPQKNFQMDFGGVMASRNISNLFFGVDYYYFQSSLTHAYLGVQTGSFYKLILLNARIDFPYMGRFYLQPEVIHNAWDYLEGTDLIQKTTPTVLKRFDDKIGLNIGLPIANHILSTVKIHGFTNSDRFSNEKKFVSGDTLDQLRTSGIKTGIEVTANNLNRKQYPSAGKSLLLSMYYFNVTENYTPGNTSVNPVPGKKHHQWFRLRGTAEQYVNMGWFQTGYYADVVFSNQPFFQNYFGTIINAPAFYPLQDSRTLILENFRSFNYLGLGSRNVFSLVKRFLDFRLEGYLFKPIEYIRQGSNQEAYSDTELTQVFFAATAQLVYHSPIGPISVSANYYDDQESNFGALFHMGFLLFNKHTLE